MNPPPNWIAFAGTRRIATGAPTDVAEKAKAHFDAHPHASLLVFDATTSQPVELDLRGALTTVLKRLKANPAFAKPPVPDPPPVDVPRGVGRPKLGVVAREVTLLPRHWEWLSARPGGASVALRKLVEHAARESREADRVKEAREAAYLFMHAMAGDAAGFESATRALFAGDQDGFAAAIAPWPRDIRQHALQLATATLPQDHP